MSFLSPILLHKMETTTCVLDPRVMSKFNIKTEPQHSTNVSSFILNCSRKIQIVTSQIFTWG